MKWTLISPRWRKLAHQTPFKLPPLGIATVAGACPPHVDVRLVDENVQEIPLDDPVDLVGISVMLAAQSRRAYEIAAAYRERGVPVIIGGLHPSLMPDEALEHADAVVVGEAEPILDRVLADAEAGRLEPLYRAPWCPDLAGAPAARRDLFDRALYTYRGVSLADLVQAARGCRYGCYPCCVPTLRGTAFRPRPVEEVVAEIAASDNDKFFLVDNTPSQNPEYYRELFAAIAPLGKRWISHPIADDEASLRAAADSGAWYIYQAIDKPSPLIRERVKRYNDHGIGVEGTILLGKDSHGPDIFERLVEFLLDIDLDIAEFTVLTPFPGSPLFDQMEAQGRILSRDWSRYDAQDVVFQPAQMTPEQLQQGFHDSWDWFYRDTSQSVRMARLIRRIMPARRRGSLQPSPSS